MTVDQMLERAEGLYKEAESESDPLESKRLEKVGDAWVASAYTLGTWERMGACLRASLKEIGW